MKNQEETVEKNETLKTKVEEMTDKTSDDTEGAVEENWKKYV